jgi:nucleoside phosphorylase
MITESFDNLTEAIIDAKRDANAPKVDACIITFSYKIRDFVLQNYECNEIANYAFTCGQTPIYEIKFNGKKFAFLMSFIGAPAAVRTLESARVLLNCDKFIAFGGASCLYKDIVHWKVIVPTAAYRDEGTSYHYVPAADYIALKNARQVAAFMEENEISYVLGKTWTTDALLRETRGNLEKRKEEGCISVDLETAALQAVCDFRGLEFYNFLTSGDLLDSLEWDLRLKDGQIKGIQHDAGYFNIALMLADYVTR